MPTLNRFALVVLSIAASVAGASALGAQEASDSLELTIVLLPEEATSAEEVVRRIALPAADPARAQGASAAERSRVDPPRRDGPETAAEARERGREFGREIAEQARENRENAGRENRGPPDGVPNGPPDDVTPPRGPPSD